MVALSVSQPVLQGFTSILFAGPGDAQRVSSAQEPDFFIDLNLGQVLNAMITGRGEYGLKPFFYVPLHAVSAIEYRHEIIRDLDQQPVLGIIRAFANRMRLMRSHLAQAQKLHYVRQQQRWFLDAADVYCEAVSNLSADLQAVGLHSRGLRGLREYVAGYAASGEFAGLGAAIRNLYADLATVKYSVLIKGSRVRVSDFEGEPDYSAEVEQAFAKFSQGTPPSHQGAPRRYPDMNHIEAHILELVTQLYPGVFAALDEFTSRYQGYLDGVLAAFDREVQFYLAYLDFIRPLREAGLSFCFPKVSAGARQTAARSCFDLALASRLVPEQGTVVCNDFQLTGPERILVVSGPNQGGKTTFARMFGQVHYLASLGLPVPGASASLPLPDRVFTHFEREEDLATLRGKLEDELARIHHILAQATGASIIVMNESFTSTTLRDALLLGTEIMQQLMGRDLLAVYVTFADELAALGPATVSMVAAIDPASPAQRTYRIVRRPADGLAYAAAIAEKYGLSYARVTQRIASSRAAGSSAS